MAKEVLDEVARAKPKKETRVNYTEKQIKDCTDECRHHGVAKGVRVYNSKHQRNHELHHPQHRLREKAQAARQRKKTLSKRLRLVRWTFFSANVRGKKPSNCEKPYD